MPLYYQAYMFFGKGRIKEGKLKSKHRLEMEKVRVPSNVDQECASVKW